MFSPVIPIDCPVCERRKKEMDDRRLRGMTNNYTVRFLRDDGKVKQVFGFPIYGGAVDFARELVGGTLVASQVRRSSDGKLLAQFLDPEIEGIMQDFFTFEAVVRNPPNGG